MNQEVVNRTERQNHNPKDREMIRHMKQYNKERKAWYAGELTKLQNMANVSLVRMFYKQEVNFDTGSGIRIN